MKYILCSLLIGFMIGQISVNKHLGNEQRSVVLALCDRFGHSQASDDQKLCGSLQTATHTEYLCSSTCWLEQK